MSVSKPSICFWKWVISIKWRNKLLIHNINLTCHRKSACCLQLFVFMETWVIAPFWHWRTQVFPKGCCYDDKSTQTRCKVCSNLTKCTTTIDFRLTSVFFINLEHLSHPTLVLLFILWKGKRWMKVRCEFFLKVIQWR